MNPRKQNIVVIGAGVIGLTSALTIQAKLADRGLEDHFQVIIVSRDFPTSTPGAPTSHDVSYASMWAGAHVRPIPASTPQLVREAAWLRTTGQNLKEQAKREPWIGVTPVLGVEYLEAPDAAYESWNPASFEEESGLKGFREIPPKDLPSDVKMGFEYQTYCLNAPLYCTGLLRKFLLQGGMTIKRNLASEWEAFSVVLRVALVVNANGTGFGDTQYFPTRGQIVLTNVSDINKTITRQNKDGSWSFVIPRFFGGGTIIGGTKEPNNWSTKPDPHVQTQLLEAAHDLDPSLFAALETGAKGSGFRVIADVVGRRPTRVGGMRIEVESRKLESGQGCVVHAYGAGGRGYEISWGVAQEVAGLALQEVEAQWAAQKTISKL